jgi:hypothetical protein
MSAIMRKGSRGHYIAWLAPNAFAISWEIDKTAMGSRLRFPIRRRSVTDRKGAERFAAKWGLVVPQGALALEVADCQPSEPHSAR